MRRSSLFFRLIGVLSSRLPLPSNPQADNVAIDQFTSEKQRRPLMDSLNQSARYLNASHCPALAFCTGPAREGLSRQ